MTSNNARIVVLQSNGLSRQHIKFKGALALVETGRARFVDGRTIQLTPGVEIVKSSPMIPNSNQQTTYELAAADPLPNFSKVA